jgi:hypothetical protein
VPEHGDIEVVRVGVTLRHIAELAEAGFGDLVKAVVGIQAVVSRWMRFRLTRLG